LRRSGVDAAGGAAGPRILSGRVEEIQELPEALATAIGGARSERSKSITVKLWLVLR
jgi:hypothetical protein